MDASAALALVHEQRELAFQQQIAAGEDLQVASCSLEQAKQLRRAATKAKQKALSRLRRLEEAYDMVVEQCRPAVQQLERLQGEIESRRERAEKLYSEARALQDSEAASRYEEDMQIYSFAHAQCTAEQVCVRTALSEAHAARDVASKAFQQARVTHTATCDAVRYAGDWLGVTEAAYLQAQNHAAWLDAAYQRQRRLVREEQLPPETCQRWARQAGIEPRHHDALYVPVREAVDGKVSIYYGGISHPQGVGHGHCIMWVSGEEYYHRRPFHPHGSHNFTRLHTDQ